MGAILNGMARHGGVIPYGATFLIFTDYMRPSIRLAAIMGCRVIYVMTHDSIGVGEDGPTHQPIEHLASLRAMPNVHVDRPGDANETAVAWRMALERRQGPTLLVLTRQKIPILPPEPVLGDDGARRGGYILEEAEGGKPAVLLLATGSEVSVALSARKLLAEEGIAARVVSMPVLGTLRGAGGRPTANPSFPASVAARVSVEAGGHLRLGAVRRPAGRFRRDRPVRGVRARGADLHGARDHGGERARPGERGPGRGERRCMEMTKNPLVALGEAGQSVWLDYIHRGMIVSGELRPADRGGRPPGRDVEPDDLREGGFLGGRLRRRRSRSWPGRRASAKQAYQRIVIRGHPVRRGRPASRVRRHEGRRRLRVAGGGARPGVRHESDRGARAGAVPRSWGAPT